MTISFKIGGQILPVGGVRHGGAEIRQTRRRSSQKKPPVTRASSRLADADDSISLWNRLTHTAALLGYGLMLSFVMLLPLVPMSRSTWGREPDDAEDDAPRLDNWVVFRCLGIPLTIGGTFSTFCFVWLTSTTPKAGPRQAWLTLSLGSALLSFPLGLMAALRAAKVDTVYWRLDPVILSVWFTMLIGLDSRVRKARARRVQDGKKRAVEFSLHSDSKKSEKKPPRWWALVRLAGLVGSLLTCFVYAYILIPLFFASGTTTRLILCLFVHPLILGVMETSSRASVTDATLRQVEQGKISLEIAETRITEYSLNTFMTQQLMAFYRRLMLINMLDPIFTFTALAVAAIEEALLRGFVVEIDTNVRRLLGKPPLEGVALRLQRVVWMCDTNQSCIAEFNAIFTSTIAHLMLQRHALMIDIGYEPVPSINAASVLMQMVVELALEAVVDKTIMYTEAVHDIPVTQYLRRMKSPAVFGFHASMSIVTLCNAIYSFIRHPTFSSCTSNDVCECSSQPAYTSWLADLCERNVGVNEVANRTNMDDGLELDTFDLFSVILTVITGFATLSIIMLAAMFARYHNANARQIKLAAKNVEIAHLLESAEANNERLKDSLERHTLSARLKSRPPGHFSTGEFEEMFEDGDDSCKEELIEAIKDLCSSWVFVRPITGNKWEYFLTNVVDLSFWEIEDHFADLKSIAERANTQLKEHIKRLLEDMATGEEHGPWLLHDLKSINEKKSICSLVEWVDEKFLKAADVLHTIEAKQEYEVNAMPAMIRSLANMLFLPFQDKLVGLSDEIKLEDETQAVPKLYTMRQGIIVTRTGRSTNLSEKRFSALGVPESANHAIRLRCSRETSVKGAKRMGVKVSEAKRKGVGFPAISNLGDALRASFSAESSEHARQCWLLISKHFQVLRLKNKFKDAFEEISSGGKLRTVSPNLHVNCLFVDTSGGFQSRIVVEIQVYDVTRADAIDALRREDSRSPESTKESTNEAVESMRRLKKTFANLHSSSKSSK